MLRSSGRVHTAFLLLLSLSSAALGQHADRAPIAVANAEPISLQEVEAAAADEIAELERRRVQFELELRREKQSILEHALEDLLSKRVIAAEAASRKVSADDLMAIEVDSVSQPPTDEAVVHFYNANKSGLEGSLADNVVAIRAYLRDQSRESLRQTFVERLKAKYGAASYMEPQRFPIPLGGHPSKGPADAPVTLVEFSDFECPFCRAIFPTLQQVTADYKDKVRIVYFQFPLADLHKQALKAAEASLCAFEQGRFWQMHDAMFSDQTNLGVQALKEKASALLLERQAFDACLDSGKHFSTVRSDVTQGVQVGVSGTPALFVNGRMLVGNQPYSEIRKIIDDELRRAAAR